MSKEYLYLVLMFFFLVILPVSVLAQDEIRQESSADDDENPVPEQVDVQPAASDDEIKERLEGIIAATDWFVDTEVDVNEGVVFLRGFAETDDYKMWAGDLARNTQDVAAVVNQIEVMEPDIWNYEPAFTGLRELLRNIMHSIPFWVFGLFVLAVFFAISIVTAKVTRASLRKREMNVLLQDIAARSVAVIVFLVAYMLFFILQI